MSGGATRLVPYEAAIGAEGARRRPDRPCVCVTRAAWARSRPPRFWPALALLSMPAASTCETALPARRTRNQRGPVAWPHDQRPGGQVGSDLGSWRPGRRGGRARPGSRSRCAGPGSGSSWSRRPASGTARAGNGGRWPARRGRQVLAKQRGSALHRRQHVPVPAHPRHVVGPAAAVHPEPGVFARR